MSEKVLLEGPDITRALTRVAHEILERNRGAEDIVLIGIMTRGMPLARRLQKAIEQFEQSTVVVGGINVGAYRDDRSAHGSEPTSKPQTFPYIPQFAPTPAQGPSNSLPFSIKDRDVVLVDDVLYTGRTVRAAMDALIDLGRPRSIQLAVLVDRGHRELPIRADYVGKNIPSSRNEMVRVRLDETDGADAVLIVTPDEAEGGAR